MHQSSSGVKSAVIDFRVRPPFNSFSNLTIFNARLAAHNRPASWVGPVPESVLQRSMDLFLAELDAAGVQRAVVWGRAVKDPNASTTLEDVADLVKRYPTRFLGFGGIRIPNNPVESEIAVSETEKALVNLGLSGITLEPGFALSPTLGPDDPNLYPVYERCQELNAVLALTISVRAGTAMKYSNPEAVDSVARRFPRLKIVIGHSCWPWVAQAIGVAYRNSNVYLHPDFYGLGCAGHQQWVEAANTLLGEQIIFGSAYPLAAVSPMVEGYRRLGFREGVLENVMYRNAARVLGIEP